MKLSIFIETHRGDFEWFKWCTLFLNLNWKTECEIVVMAHPELRHDVQLHSNGLNIKFVPYPEPEWPNGYIYQQYWKMLASRYCEGEYIMSLDPDTILHQESSLEDWRQDDKPIIWVERYDDIADKGVLYWKSCVKDVLGVDPDYEYMRLYPFIYHRSTLESCVNFIERRYNQPFRDVLLERPWNHFSEFNVLGCYCDVWEHDRYEFIKYPGKPDLVFRHWNEHKHITNEIYTQLYGEAFPDAIHITNRGYWTVARDTHFRKWVEDTGRLDHDQNLLQKIKPHIKHGTIVIDIGANIGTHTVFYADQKANMVCAYEANPVAFRCLLHNTSPYPNVSAQNIGISDQRGKIGIDDSSNNIGSAHLTGEGDIDLLTIDELHRLDENISFIKIDVEGFELKVLRGAERTIQRCNPTILIEINREALERQNTLPEHVLDFLKSLNYRIEPLSEPSDLYDCLCRPNL